jgi:two-component system, NarL family, sensor histidine kinase DevS
MARTGAFTGWSERHRWAGALLARPQLLLRLCAAAILLAAIGVVLLMLRVPDLPIAVGPAPRDMILLSTAGAQLRVPADAPVQVRSPVTGDEVRVRAALLNPVTEPRGTAAENAAFWRMRDRISAMVAAGPVTFDHAGRRIQVTGRPRTLAMVPLAFWLALGSGAIGALVGLWVWVLRPRAWAPAMFGLSGIGLFLGCTTLTVAVSSGLGISGRAAHVLMIVNYPASALFTGSLAALFARFPTPLLASRWLWPIAIVSLAMTANVWFDWLPPAADFGLVVVLCFAAAIVLLLALQAWHARRDRAARAALLPLAGGTTIATILFSVLSVIGQWQGGAPLVLPDLTTPLLLLIYLGLGLAVIRARLFELGRWALGTLLSACAVILFLVLDPLLLATVTPERDIAFVAAAAIGALVYLPARSWLLRKAERLRERRATDMLQYASDMALALTPDVADQAWHAAATAMFDPLEVARAEPAGDMPAIQEAGGALHLPSPLGAGALLIRYPGGGTRMFGAEDVAMAAGFAGHVRHLVEARDAYLRGVTEERGRIARDLHDDVSARLLTSLHRTDTRAMHEDVRGAMADIRTIVTGLSGQPQSLETLFADLRHETQTRLEAAGITLHWPLPPADIAAHALDYATYRHLLSIVRECISNVIRHADAATVWVETAVSRGWLVLDISDDGCGLEAARSDGRGLANAQRRAGAMGGSFGIAAGDGRTRARLEVPLARDAEAQPAVTVTLR